MCLTTFNEHFLRKFNSNFHESKQDNSNDMTNSTAQIVLEGPSSLSISTNKAKNE